LNNQEVLPKELSEQVFSLLQTIDRQHADILSNLQNLSIQLLNQQHLLPLFLDYPVFNDHNFKIVVKAYTPSSHHIL